MSSLSSYLSMGVSLFFISNILGNIPVFIKLLDKYDAKKQRKILIREFFFALIILIIFNYFGSNIFSFLGITPPILSIGGGILLLLIGFGMVFPSEQGESAPPHEPILVPLAIPLISGPGSIAAVMLFSSSINNPLITSCIIFASVFLSYCFAILAFRIKHALGERTLISIERLGGMIVTLLASQMIISGIIELVQIEFNI